MPIESISFIEVEFDMILAEMKKVNVNVTALLEKLLMALFEKARSFDGPRSATYDVITNEANLELISEVKRQLGDIVSNEQVIISRINDLQVELSLLKINRMSFKRNWTNWRNTSKKFVHLFNKMKRN